MKLSSLLSISVWLLISGFSLPNALAISERDYQREYTQKVLPFLRSGELFSLPVDADVVLRGVQYRHPHSRGTILVLTGRSEPWLKYGEVFYDLFQKGFSIISYDHRGQGLSTHLSKKNSQIGHVERFGDYISDLDAVVNNVVRVSVPSEEPLYLLAHSVGATIALGYLEVTPSVFRAVALSSPMLQIDTKPYPEFIAKAVLAVARVLGKADDYALGRHNYDPNSPFEKNDVTGSAERFWMANTIFKLYPESIIGGPSSGWVERSLTASSRIAERMSEVTSPLSIFQAGRDQIVKLPKQSRGCEMAKACILVRYPNAQHEILMEKDSIRDDAFTQIESHFH